MPITQQRMLSVLDEATRLAAWYAELHASLQRILLARDLHAHAKLDTIAVLLESEPPACVQCALEREHFRKARKRNEKSALRMAKQREQERTR
jgi:hypothetical protein